MRFKLKKSVLIKDNSSLGVLVFSTENDKVYQFVGDSSLAVAMLSKHSKKDGLTMDELCKELSEVSRTFQANKFQIPCLEEFFTELRSLELLDQ